MSSKCTDKDCNCREGQHPDLIETPVRYSGNNKFSMSQDGRGFTTQAYDEAGQGGLLFPIHEACMTIVKRVIEHRKALHETTGATFPVMSMQDVYDVLKSRYVASLKMATSGKGAAYRFPEPSNYHGAAKLHWRDWMNDAVENACSTDDLVPTPLCYCSLD